MITLRNGGAELDLLPEIGGAVTRFEIDGRDILRRAPEVATDVLQTSCFPLVPFANRIANGMFTFDGTTLRLPRNFGEHPHVLHGQGWQGAWRERSLSKSAATLEFDHGSDAWPWDYAARQTFELSADSLLVSLELVNRSACVMPASLGFHPYFKSTPRALLRAGVAGVWLSDEHCIPTEQAGPAHFLDLENGVFLADAPFVDHCHFGWNRRAYIGQPEYERCIVLSASSGLGFLHCYIPQKKDFFCLEPVTAMPDAFNRPRAQSGLQTLASGEALVVSMKIAVAPCDGSVANSTP